MLGCLRLYLKGMRIFIFQNSGFYLMHIDLTLRIFRFWTTRFQRCRFYKAGPGFGFRILGFIGFRLQGSGF